MFYSQSISPLRSRKGLTSAYDLLLLYPSLDTLSAEANCTSKLYERNPPLCHKAVNVADRNVQCLGQFGRGIKCHGI